TIDDAHLGTLDHLWRTARSTVMTSQERSQPTVSLTPRPWPLEDRQHTKRCWWNWIEAKRQCENDCPTRREPGIGGGERSARAEEQGSPAASPPSLDIQVLPEEASEDADAMRHLDDLINPVYAAAEKGQWRPGATRTSVEEITELTRVGQMVVAR